RFPTQFFQACDKRRDPGPLLRVIFALWHEHTHTPDALGLLRPRAKWPRSRPAEQRDELAALHSITSSARCCRNQGTSRPRAFAVLRLMTSSNVGGCSTGISAGFTPCKILTTNAAARRNESGPSAP